MKIIITPILVLFLSLNINAAEQCEDVYDRASVALSEIQNQLKVANSKSSYEKSVKGRFDAVSALLRASDVCQKPKEMSADFLDNWQQMYMTLTSLQATAQLSAFSGFSNWVESKERDLTAFEYAKNVSWKR